MILITALSYGLTRVPKRIWERRDLRVIFGYHCFCIKQLQEDKRDALFDLETQYAVDCRITKIFNHLKKKLKYDMATDKAMALTYIENSIP